jgi:hypothetical protein
MAIKQKFWFYGLGLIFLAQIVSIPITAQPWELVKEQDGIKIYTRNEAGKSLKSYKGTAMIKAPAARVFAMIEDVHHTEWWDPKISEIKVLAYEKNKSARYYLVFDSPWPVDNRDLCVDVTVKSDPAKNSYTVKSVPLTGVIPEKEGKVRIKNYAQTWTITSAGPNESNVVVEGFVDPGGSIPSWITNMLVTEGPIGSIQGIIRQEEKRTGV